MQPTKQELVEALNILRLARKESTQKFVKASYSKPVQSIFNYYDLREGN